MVQPKRGNFTTLVGIIINPCFCCCCLLYLIDFFFAVDTLLEDKSYTFQVFAMSHQGYQAGSNEFDLYVPPLMRMRAIAIGATAGLLVLLAASAVFIYTKKKCFNPYDDSDEKR